MVSPYEREAIRPHLFGSFRALLGAVAHHPAMLFYLDNWTSTREGFSLPKRGRLGLNENYARELLELHTLGVDGGYTQEDVREVARCFTGWGIRQAATRTGASSSTPRRTTGAASGSSGRRSPPAAGSRTASGCWTCSRAIPPPPASSPGSWPRSS